MKDDNGTNKMIHEYKGSKVEMTVPVIGTDVHEFMEMVVGFMRATQWGNSTIMSGLAAAQREMQDSINIDSKEASNDNDD